MRAVSIKADSPARHRPVAAGRQAALLRVARRYLAVLLPGSLLLYFLSTLAVRPLRVPDEGRYPEIAREMLLNGDFITPHLNGVPFLDKPPLFYWLQTLAYRLFGIDLWSIRLMPALFGIAGCLLVYYAGRRCFGRRAALLSVLVLATSPFYFIASQFANLDLEVAVLIEAALFAFLLAWREPAASRARFVFLLLAYLACGFGVLAKGLIGLVLPFMIVGTWLILMRRWRDIPAFKPLSGLLLIAVICLPWFYAVQQANPWFFDFFFIYQQFDRFVGHDFNSHQPLWFYLPVLAAGLFPWSLLLPHAVQAAWRELRQGGESRPVLLLLLLWPVLIVLFFSLPASKVVGYVLPALPALALLLGHRLDRWLREGPQGELRWRSLAAFALVMALAALALLWAVPGLAARYGRPQLLVELRGLAVWLAALALLAGWARRWAPLRGVALLALAGMSFCLSAVLLSPAFDEQSTQALAQILRQQAGAQDRIVVYGDYPQDLPLYLDRRQPLTVVADWTRAARSGGDNWRRELYFGREHAPESAAWLLSAEQFAALPPAPGQLYLLFTPAVRDELGQRYLLQYLGAAGHLQLARVLGPAPAHEASSSLSQ